MSLINFRGYSSSGLGWGDISTTADKDKQLALFQRELGTAAMRIKNKSIITAFTKPDKAIDEYSAALLKFEARACDMYIEALTDGAACGLPREVAMSMAKATAAHFLDDKMEYLNIVYPFASNAESLIALKTGKTRSEILKEESRAEK